MRSTSYTLEREIDGRTLVVDLIVVGEAEYDAPSYRGHPDYWHAGSSYCELVFAIVDSEGAPWGLGTDIEGLLTDSEREDLEQALLEAVVDGKAGDWSGPDPAPAAEPPRAYSYSAVRASELMGGAA